MTHETSISLTLALALLLGTGCRGPLIVPLPPLEADEGFLLIDDQPQSFAVYASDGRQFDAPIDDGDRNIYLVLLGASLLDHGLTPGRLAPSAGGARARALPVGRGVLSAASRNGVVSPWQDELSLPPKLAAYRFDFDPIGHISACALRDQCLFEGVCGACRLGLVEAPEAPLEPEPAQLTSYQPRERAPWIETPCADDHAQFFGSAVCEPVGDACPEGEFAAPPSGPFIETRPETFVADLANAAPGTTLLLSRGQFAAPFAFPPSVRLKGACVGGTELVRDERSIVEGSLSLEDLTLSMELLVNGSAANLELNNIVFPSTRALVLRNHAQVLARRLVIRGAPEQGLNVAGGARLEVRAGSFLGPGASAVVSDGTMILSDIRASEVGLLAAVEGATLSIDRIELENSGILAETQGRLDLSNAHMSAVTILVINANASLQASILSAPRPCAIAKRESGRLRMQDVTIRNMRAVAASDFAVCATGTLEVSGFAMVDSLGSGISLDTTGPASLDDIVLRDLDVPLFQHVGVETTVRRMLVEGAREAIKVQGKLVAEDWLIRDADYDEPAAIVVREGGTLSLTRGNFSEVAGAAVVLDSTATLQDIVITHASDVDPDSCGLCTENGSLTAQRIRVDGLPALSAMGERAVLSISDLRATNSVRDAVSVRLNARFSGSRIRVDSARGGVYFGAGASSILSDIAIHDVETAINVVERELHLTRMLARNVRRFGLQVSVGAIEATSVDVAGTDSAGGESTGLNVFQSQISLDGFILSQHDTSVVIVDSLVPPELRNGQIRGTRRLLDIPATSEPERVFDNVRLQDIESIASE